MHNSSSKDGTHVVASSNPFTWPYVLVATKSSQSEMDAHLCYHGQVQRLSRHPSKICATSVVPEGSKARSG